MFLLSLAPVFAAQSGHRLIYTLAEGEVLDTGFTYYFNDKNQIHPCLRIKQEKHIYIIYREKKYGPYKRVSKRLFDSKKRLILLELKDEQDRSFILSADNRLFGPFQYILDWKYNALNHLWMAQVLHGSQTVLINGKSYGPYMAVWDIAFNRNGTRWSFLAKEGNIQFYVTDRWNQYLKEEETALDLYKPEEVRYFKHYRDADWEHWVVVYEWEKKYYLNSDKQKILGPFDSAGEVQFYGPGQWVVPVIKERKQFLLDSGVPLPVSVNLVKEKGTYVLPGEQEYPYLYMSKGLLKKKLHWGEMTFGPFKEMGIGLDRPVISLNGHWFTTLQFKQGVTLIQDGKNLDTFQDINGFYVDENNKSWMTLVQPLDDSFFHWYTPEGLHLTRIKELVHLDYQSSEKYIFTFLGQDEKYYVESSDGRQWGPFEKVFRAFLEDGKPVFSVMTGQGLAVYREGFPLEGKHFSLMRESIPGKQKDKVYFLNIQGENILLRE